VASSEVNRALGRIEGKLESIETQNISVQEKLDALSQRLTNHEITAARNGSVSGGIVSILVTLISHLVFPGGGSPPGTGG
jgi:hypothetical protein